MLKLQKKEVYQKTRKYIKYGGFVENVENVMTLSQNVKTKVFQYCQA